MDYGKIAYLKAEELENRLSLMGAKSAREACTDFTAKPVFDLSGGEYFVGNVSAGGSAFFFVRAEVRLDSDVNDGRFDVLVNGLSAGGCELGGVKGETKTLFVMCAAYINGTARAEVTAYGADCTLISCQLLISGAGADIARTGGAAATDNSGDVWLVVTGDDGYITARSFTEDNFELSEPIYIGAGTCGDVAGGNNCFAVSYIDPAGNVFVVMLDTDLNFSGRTYVCAGAKSAAIGSYRDGFILACGDGSGIEFRYVDAGGGVSAAVSRETIAGASRIGFVKKANPPMLTVTESGRSYVKFALVEHGGDDVIRVTADAEITAVTV